MAAVDVAVTDPAPPVPRQRVVPQAGDVHPTPQGHARLASVDVLRGLVMAVMALDHVRDYFTHFGFNWMDPAQTTPACFFTRWLTHFCAPAFFLLAGMGAFLSASKGKPTGELS